MIFLRQNTQPKNEKIKQKKLAFIFTTDMSVSMLLHHVKTTKQI